MQSETIVFEIVTVVHAWQDNVAKLSKSIPADFESPTMYSRYAARQVCDSVKVMFDFQPSSPINVTYTVGDPTLNIVYNNF